MDVQPTERRCGTCDLFVFGHLSFCGWRWKPGAKKVSAAYKAGGEGHAMWVNDGRDCATWKAIKPARKVRNR